MHWDDNISLYWSAFQWDWLLPNLPEGWRKKRKKTRGGEGKAGLLLKGQLISCFCFWPLSAWTQSEGNMSEPMGCIAGWSTLSHISSHFSLFPSHSLFWSHYRRSHLSSCSFLTKTSLSYPVLHNEGPLLIWRLWSKKHPLFPPVEGSLQIYKLIWVYEDRVGWGVPFCLPPNIMMRRADWSVKGDINLLSIYWGLNIQLVSYADCIL